MHSEEKREKYEAGNRDKTRNACRTLLLHSSMGSTAAAGWSRQREDAAAQCDSLCSAASTVSSLSMLLCDGRHSSVSAATPAGASFGWECAQHGYSFGGKLDGLQSRAGQQRSHPYSKSVLAARASSPPAVQGSGVVVIFNNDWLQPDFDENSRELF